MSITIEEFKAVQDKVKRYNNLEGEVEEIETAKEAFEDIKNTKLEAITFRIERLEFEIDIPKGSYFEVVGSIINALSIREKDIKDAMENIREQVSDMLRTEECK